MLTFSIFVIMLVGTEIFRRKYKRRKTPIVNKHAIFLIGLSVILFSLMASGCAEQKNEDLDIRVSGMVQSVSAYDNTLGQDYRVDVIITNEGQDTVSFRDIYAFFDSTGYEDSPLVTLIDERNATLGPGESIPGSYSSKENTQKLFKASKNGNIAFRIGFVTDDNIPFTTSAILPRLGAKNGLEQEMEVGDTAVLIFTDDKAVTDALNF